MRACSAILLAVAALGLSACGSGGNDPAPPKPPAISTATAAHLAKLSERVASDLDAGDTCDAAHAADELRAAVQESDLSPALRPGVDEVAGTLVDEVNCPPPPAPPPTKEKKKPKKGDDEHHGGHGDEHGGDQGFTPPGHSGGLPPGQAKLKGEQG